MRNRLPQDPLDFAQENFRPCRIEGVGRRQRMHAGAMQGLTTVDVAETRNTPLIHKEGFDLRSSLQNVTEFAY